MFPAAMLAGSTDVRLPPWKMVANTRLPAAFFASPRGMRPLTGIDVTSPSVVGS